MPCVHYALATLICVGEHLTLGATLARSRETALHCGVARFPQVRQSFNLDIRGKFANLIVVQRACEVNTKAVTSFDQITEETINLKQVQAAGKQT